MEQPAPSGEGALDGERNRAARRFHAEAGIGWFENDPERRRVWRSEESVPRIAEGSGPLGAGAAMEWTKAGC